MHESITIPAFYGNKKGGIILIYLIVECKSENETLFHVILKRGGVEK